MLGMHGRMIAFGPMAYWILKTEPGAYSFDDLVRDKKTRWDGITNPVALRHLRSAAKGDTAVIYHTGDERAAIGLAEVLGPAYPDPDRADPKLAVIDIQAGKRLARPVTLDEIKRSPAFADSPLVRQGRLSFVPLTQGQWEALTKLAGG
jgi:predicted RNA-binding protein with PUA-like domain